jgi:hypothetical protein
MTVFRKGRNPEARVLRSSLFKNLRMNQSQVWPLSPTQQKLFDFSVYIYFLFQYDASLGTPLESGDKETAVN